MELPMNNLNQTISCRRLPSENLLW